MSVDVRQYMAAAIANADGTGDMLCENPPGPDESATCITSFYDGNDMGEVKIAYGANNGVVDYIGIGSQEYNPFGEGFLQYIGVIRNLNGTGGALRCFTNPLTNCTAPASGYSLEGMPYLITALPEVSYATELATENSDGSPNHEIPGALITTPNSSSSPRNYWTYAVNDYNNTSQCAQTSAGSTQTQNQVVYVDQIPFGGTIGTQDAIVTDGFAIGPPNHVERYYYVKGYGRVRESVAWQATGQSGYDNDPANGKYATNILHNGLQPLNTATININTGGCGQGSAVSIF